VVSPISAFKFTHTHTCPLSSFVLQVCCKARKPYDDEDPQGNPKDHIKRGDSSDSKEKMNKYKGGKGSKDSSDSKDKKLGGKLVDKLVDKLLPYSKKDSSDSKDKKKGDYPKPGDKKMSCTDVGGEFANFNFNCNRVIGACAAFAWRALLACGSSTQGTTTLSFASASGPLRTAHAELTNRLISSRASGPLTAVLPQTYGLATRICLYADA
jgi:hypothetical protein